MRLVLLLAIASAQALACGKSERPPDPDPIPTLTLSRLAPNVQEIRVDGEAIGRLEREGGRATLSGPGVVAHLERSEAPVEPGRPYPRRVRTEGRLQGLATPLRQEYTLLAPSAPLAIEGLGLEVSSDEPGLNREEHRELTEWLAGRGLAGTQAFQALHQADTGRELRVWYEISGRRVDGRLVREGAARPLARVDSLFRSENGALKIHHKRPGENGRFTYHRQSLELADSVASEDDGLPSLDAHQCGCYGYAIAADFMTLGRSLYQVEADWLDDRVAADFFIGLERREGFPWIGLGDRRRMRDLARRVTAFRLKDASGALFAEVDLALPDDPPSPDLGEVTYRVDLWSEEGERRPFARIHRGAEGTELAFFAVAEGWETGVDRLDELLAAMPTQVMRGDGIRDSHLGEVEELLDMVRLLRDPVERRLADLVSDVDAWTAPAKVKRLLEPEAERFVADAETLPPAPMRVMLRAGS